MGMGTMKKEHHITDLNCTPVVALRASANTNVSYRFLDSIAKSQTQLRWRTLHAPVGRNAFCRIVGELGFVLKTTDA